MAQAGSFEEWLAKVEDDEQAKAEEKRQADAEAREAALRKQQSTEGAFETWVQGKAHRARAVEVSLWERCCLGRAAAGHAWLSRTAGP